MSRRKPATPRRRPMPARRTGQLPITTSLPELLEAFKDAPHDVARGLAVGEALLRHRLEHKVVETLLHLDERYPFKDPRYAEFYNRLMALGYIHRGDFPGAERIIERSLRDFGPSLDIYFVQAYAKLSMREYEAAAASAAAYEQLYETVRADDRPTLDLCRTAGHASQVANFLGVAEGHAERFREAEAAYRRAIAADSGNHLPYLNLLNLLKSTGESAKMTAVLEQGLKQARQVTELRMMQETLSHSARISACMIVKNEEELLPGCLESIRDWVDEIIVVDTGSTDRTVDIARQYGARVFHQPWTGDFSYHRNYSLQQASGDWIFIIDADERIVSDDVPLIRHGVDQTEYAVLSLGVYNVYGRDAKRVTYSNSVRFFRRDLNLHYEGIVHNDLVIPKDQPILRTRVRLRHLGYDLDPERMKQKFERTHSLLLKQLEENPDNTYALFNYAELLRGVEPVIQPDNAREVLRAAGRVVELTSVDDPAKRHLHLMCLNHVAVACLALGENERALEVCNRALAAKPNYLDALISRGMACHRLHRYPEATEQFLHYLDAQAAFDSAAEVEPIILSHPDSRDLAHNNLGILYQLTGRPDDARRHYLQALEINPGYRETASLLGMLCLGEGKAIEAEVWFRHQLEHSDPTREALLGLAEICVADGRGEEAEEQLKRAVAVFADDPEVQLAWGRFLVGRGRFDESAAVFDALIAGHDDPVLISRLADLYYEAGELERAAAYYERALQGGVASPELLNNLGNCHYKGEAYEEAVNWYRRAVELAPDHLIARRNLGLAQVRLGRAEEAIQTLKSCLERNPDASEIAHLLADQYRTSEKFDEAVRLYEQVLRQRPDNFAALFNLAESYLLMGHGDSALAGYRRVLQLKPGFQPALERVTSLTGAPVGS